MPKAPKSWPPIAKLSLLSQSGLQVQVSTVGTQPGRTGRNRAQASLSQLASFSVAWGDGTTTTGAGAPPATLTHIYPAAQSTAVIQLSVTDTNTLTASVQLTVNNISDPILPSVPTAVSVTTTGQTTITVTWTDVPMTAQVFQILRALSGGTPIAIAQVSAPTLVYNDTGLTANTAYDYQVVAVAGLFSSAPSATASATTFPAIPPATPPNAPSVLSAVAISQTRIDLGWTDNAGDEVGFSIERATGAGPFAQIATVSANVVTYSDTTVVAATTYNYRVRAYNEIGNSAYSNTASVLTPSNPVPTVPTAPSVLAITSTSLTQIALGWQDNSSDETSFDLQRRIGTGNFATLATLPAGTVAYVDTAVVASTTYGYRIRAVNAVGASAFSNTASATTPAAPVPHPPIATLSAPVTQVTLGGNLTLSTAGTQAGDFPLATWSLDWKDGTIQSGAGTPPTTLSRVYTVAGSYVPQLTVVDSAATQALASSPVLSVTAIVPPAAPTNLVATPTGQTTVSLTWLTVAASATAVVVERKTGAGAQFAVIATLAPTATTYGDSGLTASTTYVYQLRATNAGGSSSASASATVTTNPVVPPPTVPIAPSNLVAPLSGQNSVALAWQDNSSDEQGFKAERQVNAGAFSQIAQVGAGVTAYTDPNLAQGSYGYRVRAFNAVGNSAYSNIVPITISPVLGKFVSPGGNNSNPGTFDFPYRTISYGITQMQPGTPLFVRGGTYPEAITGAGMSSGTSWSNKISIAAYAGETVWLTPTSGAGIIAAVIWLDANVHYVEFDGINIDARNTNLWAAWASTNNGNNPHHIRFKNLEAICGEVGWGGTIELGGHTTIGATGFNEVINCVIHGGGITGGSCGPGCNNYCVYLAGPDNLIENCDMYNPSGLCLQIYNADGDPANRNIVRNNKMHDLSRTGQPGLAAAMLIAGDDNQVYNNVLYNINAGGIGEGISVYYGARNLLSYNTIYNVPGAGVTLSSGASNTRTRNTIAFATGNPYSDSGSGNTQSNNLFGPNPLFVNQGASNFHLQSGSPARGAGVAIAGITTDKDGVTRGNPPDIGAYQYV